MVRFFWHFIVKTRDSPNWADIQHAFLISLIHWCHILCYKLRLQDFRLFCFRLTFEIWQKKETNLCLWFFKLKHVSSPRVWLSGVWGKNTLRQLVSFICICIIGHCKTTSENHTVNDRLLLTWFKCSYISLQLISEEAPWCHSCNIKQFLSWHITTHGAYDFLLLLIWTYM